MKTSDRRSILFTVFAVLVWNFGPAHASQVGECPTAFQDIAQAGDLLSARLRPGELRSQGESSGSAIKDGHRVWNVITNRTYDHYLEQLELINRRQRGRIFRSLPKFDESKIISGERSILSIGEGGSDFIATLLSKRVKQDISLDSIRNIHAVDTAYTAENSDPRFFHRQVIQSLKVLDSAGNRIFFDEIVASWSLNFLLDGASPLRTAELLEVVLKNLKPNGTLRIWPGVLEEEQGAIARILQKKGLIKNWWFGEETVLQRSDL